ncbi:MAG: hypothetical protein KDA41_22065, partial [Planctomycetales bacterium]|nr:hypothetical protein [Planctomycetales bacterium]
TIYTYNLTVFDPTWFWGYSPSEKLRPPGAPPPFAARGKVDRQGLIERLQLQMAAKDSPKLHTASRGYIEFLQLGGVIKMEDLDSALLRKYLKRSVPILTGLSSTYLYGDPREFGPQGDPDDIRGCATGHFVVLYGYDKEERTVQVADPWLPNPLGEQHHYDVELDRLISSILLGVLTYDANLLVIEPKRK